MTLKTERKCTWEEIEVGEVFAWASCFVILIKLAEHSSLCLCTDHAISQNSNEGEDFGGFKEYKSLYKLPLSVQRLWKEI